MAYTDGAGYTMGAADVTLYAVWVKNVINYTITFNANGGEGTMMPQTVESGATTTLTANAFTRTGYTFAGWATTATGTATYADKAPFVMNTANVTLYAVWTKEIISYTITFDANGGEGTMTAQTIISGTAATLTANAYTKKGYQFAGWATSATGESTLADQSSYTMETDNVTLYAIWVTSSLCFAERENGFEVIGLAEPTGDIIVPAYFQGLPVTKIGNHAFSGHTKITSITIPDSVTNLGIAVFKDSTGLTSVTLSKSITDIGCATFEGCIKLTSITIPDSVTVIADFAFRDCTGLTSMAIPNSVVSIGDHAFYGCSGLTSLYIPNTATTIGDSAFEGCSSLNILNISTGVTSIGDSAFAGCSELTILNIPAGITSIEEGTFAGCSGLTILTIPDTVTSIGNSSFCQCDSLSSVSIPAGVTWIGDYAFFDCSGLTTITVQATKPPMLGPKIFEDCSALTTISVPAASVDAYKNTDGWKDYASKIIGF